MLLWCDFLRYGSSEPFFVEMYNMDFGNCLANMDYMAINMVGLLDKGVLWLSRFLMFCWLCLG